MRMFKGIIGMTLAFVLVLSINKVVNIVVEHFDHIDDIESANQTLLSSNSILKDNNDVLQSAIIESEEGKGVLINEITRLQGANDEYERSFKQQQSEFEVQNRENHEAIEAMVVELRKAGLHNIRLPDSIIRMQRDKAKAVNARASSYYKAEDGHSGKQAE